MSMYKKLIGSLTISLLFLLSATPSFAQQNDVKVTGKITDGSGAPLAGVVVVVKDGKSNNGAVSNTQGVYEIKVPASSTLLFTCLGYTDQEVKLGASNVVNVTMTEDAQSLDEVVVVGYGTQKKKDLTGGLAVVSKQTLEMVSTNNLMDRLVGQVAGLNITTGNEAPGSNQTLLIRGQNSLTASNDPLIILDGIPYSGGLADLDPNIIENMSVLKDASAVAIYGSRGSCGVILITTKRGEGERPVVSYDGQFSVSSVSKTIDMLNAYEFAKIFKEARDGAYLFNVPTGSIDDPYEDRPQTYHRVDPLITAYLQDKTGTMTDTDWQDAIFRTAYSTKHSVSVSGRTKTLGYYIGANYLYREGTIIGSDFERYSLRANIDGKRNRLKYGVSFSPSYSKTNYISSDTQYGDDGVIASALMAPPVFPVYNTDGSYNWDMNGFLRVNSWDTQTNEVLNPVALALEIDDVREKINILGNAYVSYEFIKGLEYKFTAGGDYYSYIRNYYRPSYIPLRGHKYYDDLSAPKAQNNMNSYFHWTISNQLSFNRTFGDHSVNAVAVYEAEKQGIQTSSTSPSRPSASCSPPTSCSSGASRATTRSAPRRARPST